jgi:hypothetical protein
MIIRVVDHPVYYPVDRPMDQLMDRPADQLMDRPADQLMDRPADQLMDRPADQLMDRPADQLMDRPMDLPVGPVGLVGPVDCSMVMVGLERSILATSPGRAVMDRQPIRSRRGSPEIWMCRAVEPMGRVVATLASTTTGMTTGMGVIRPRDRFPSR